MSLFLLRWIPLSVFTALLPRLVPATLLAQVVNQPKLQVRAPRLVAVSWVLLVREMPARPLVGASSVLSSAEAVVAPGAAPVVVLKGPMVAAVQEAIPVAVKELAPAVVARVLVLAAVAQEVALVAMLRAVLAAVDQEAAPVVAVGAALAVVVQPAGSAILLEATAVAAATGAQVEVKVGAEEAAGAAGAAGAEMLEGMLTERVSAAVQQVMVEAVMAEVVVNPTAGAEVVELSKAVESQVLGRSLPLVAAPLLLNPFLKSLSEAKPSNREPQRLLWMVRLSQCQAQETLLSSTVLQDHFPPQELRP